MFPSRIVGKLHRLLGCIQLEKRALHGDKLALEKSHWQIFHPHVYNIHERLGHILIATQITKIKFFHIMESIMSSK